MKIDVVLTPRLLPPRFEDALCVVIDVLRATTTIVAALANGASEVRPCITAAEARRCAKSENDIPFLLGGERGGLRIPGFHLGNSPAEYHDANKISGRVIYFSTTNGTPALRKAYKGGARPMYLAALVNMSAVSSVIVRAAMNNALKRIFLICAGCHSKASLEDTYCAGLIVPRLQSELAEYGISPEPSDAAILAAEYSRMNVENPLAVLTASEHGRYLESIGFADDLEYASQIDVYDIVPYYDGQRIIIGPE
ncbi:MAG: 2-phosphosulfolactate phosphatase [Chloroflexi bacterium]|nr:2-phosphosulfolactate phosphatase [Chloroflexota bacterium]